MNALDIVSFASCGVPAGAFPRDRARALSRELGECFSSAPRNERKMHVYVYGQGVYVYGREYVYGQHVRV